MVKSNGPTNQAQVGISGENHFDQDDRISTSSKQQRENTANTGAFGRRVGSSDLIFLEGILPESNGTVLNDNSIKEQTTACLNRLESILSARGVGLTAVLKVEIQLTDPASRDAVDEVYTARAWERYPPRSVVGVSWLPGGAAVQFDVVAAAE